MVNTSKIAVLALLTSVAVTGASYAADTKMDTKAHEKAPVVTISATKHEAHPFKLIDKAKVAAWKTGKVEVEPLATLDKALQTEIGKVAPGDLATLKTEIGANAALTAELKKKAVDVSTIAGVEELKDGTVSIYIR